MTGPVSDVMIQAGVRVYLGSSFEDEDDLIRAIYLAMKSKEQASVHSPDEIERLKCDIGDAIRSEENPVKTGDDYATGFNNGLRLARRVVFTLLDRAAIAAMNTASDNGRLRKALEAIRDYDMGDDLNSMECQSCHDKGFEHYWAIKKIARTALQHPAKEMGE